MYENQRTHLASNYTIATVSVSHKPVLISNGLHTSAVLSITSKNSYFCSPQYSKDHVKTAFKL